MNMLNNNSLQRMFGKSFYNQFKGLEKSIKIIRNHKYICDIKGVVTRKVLILPPSDSIPIKDGDIVDDGYNKSVVIHIQDEGSKNTVWQLRLERLSEMRYKKRAIKNIITNKISNGDINQNVGSHNNIQNTKNVSKYSVNDIAKFIPNAGIDDQQQLVKLESIFNNIKEHKNNPKRGFLKKFDSLFGKYPNITNVVSNLLLQWAETGFMH